MTYRSATAIAALLTGFASPSIALDFGNGFSVTGDVELEYLTEGGSDDSANGFADVTLGWRSQAGGAIGFGFDLTVNTIQQLDEGDGFTSYWGGLVLTTGVGEVTVGNPRPLLKTMINSPDVGAARLYDLEFSTITGSTMELVALTNDENLYGISFKGGAGALTYGASYHSVEGENIDIVELAANYTVGNTLIQGGLELIDTPTASLEKVLIGATQSYDRWSAGAIVGRVSQGSEDVNSLKIFGDYNVTDALTVGAQVLTINGGGDSETYYGVSGEYGFGPGGFANLGLLDSDNNGGDAVYNASVGFRF
jgi:Gram-negative porin